MSKELSKGSKSLRSHHPGNLTCYKEKGEVSTEDANKTQTLKPFCVSVCVSPCTCVSAACMQRALAEHVSLRLDTLDGKYPSNTSKIIQQSLLLLLFHTIFDLPNPRLLLFLIHLPVPASLWRHPRADSVSFHQNWIQRLLYSQRD